MRPLVGIDLCCGAGGWACAALGLPRPIQWAAVVDIDPTPLATWRTNHGAQHPDCRIICGDLTDSTTLDQLRDLRPDIIVGGIPCEQVSVARSNYACDPDTLAAWHRLIDSMFGLVRDLRPDHWCFEDVIQVEKHLPPPTVAGVPYHHCRIDARHFQPQRRLRTYIGDFVKPRPLASPRRLAECWLPGPYAEEVEMHRFEQISISGRGNGRLGNIRIRVIEPTDTFAPTVLTSIGRGSRQRRSFYRRLPNGRAVRLSWQETALIQGFPRDYVFCGPVTQINAQVGRAIPIDVGRAILGGMIDGL